MSMYLSDKKYIYTVKLTGDINATESLFADLPYLSAIYIDKGSSLDGASIFPEGVVVKYNDDDSEMTQSTETASEETTEITTSETDSETTTKSDQSTETTTEQVLDGDILCSIKYDSGLRKRYSSTEYSAGFAAATDSSSTALTELDTQVRLHTDEMLTITLKSTLGNTKKKYVYTYDQLADGNISAIWISNDKAYITKPDVWVEDYDNYEPFKYPYGDVDGDGQVTVLDAAHVLKKASDITYKFPIE